MKKRFFLTPATLLTALFASAQGYETTIPDEDHLSYFDLRGPVQEVREYDYANHAKTLWRFDKQGRLTHYEAYATPFAGNGGCVFGMTDRYRYAYDEEGKMIILETFNEVENLVDENDGKVLTLFPMREPKDVLFEQASKEQQLADQQQEIQQKQARLKALLFFSILALLVIALLVGLVVLLRHRNTLIAQQAADKKRQYGILSHDLRNPVMAQQQLLQMLYTNYASYKPEEAHKLIGQLLAGSDNQLALLRNLQEIVQLDRQARCFRTAQLDLAAVLRDTVPDVQSAALLKNVTIDMHAERLLVETDREMIRTVLRNLLSNAIKFSPRGSTIEVGTIAPAAFYVRDHGVGMTREQIRRILTDQKQVESSVGTDGESGTGYGLILCRELLNLCHCKLDIQSVKGEGTTFTIDLQHAYYPINKYESRYTR